MSFKLCIIRSILAFYFIVGISLLFLIGLTVTMLYFVFRYNKKKNKIAVQNEGNITLGNNLDSYSDSTGTGDVLFWLGRMETNDTKPPKDAMNVTSTARMWSFSFQYENGKQSPDLVVPVNTPVKINLISLDVIHSLFIPAFRIKSDMVPGREKMMWFLPQREGEYDLYCAEYCGLQHSYMNSNVKVLSKEKFDYMVC